MDRLVMERRLALVEHRLRALREYLPVQHSPLITTAVPHEGLKARESA